MSNGDEVVFWITGCIPKYKGIVTDTNGAYGHPEIRVTHVLRGEAWEKQNDWPTLKAGDYILTEEA